MCTRADRKECAHSKKKKQKNVKLEINSFRNVPVFELPPQNERRSNKRDSVQTVILGIDVGAMVSTPAFRARASKTRAGLESRLLEKSIIQ
jgi:hypothetical protein